MNTALDKTVTVCYNVIMLNDRLAHLRRRDAQHTQSPLGAERCRDVCSPFVVMNERYADSRWIHISAEFCADRAEVQAWVDKIERGDHPEWTGRWADDRDWFEAYRRQEWDGSYIG